MSGGGLDGGVTGRCVAGRYVLEAALGAGAHGQVFRATDRVSGERVAVKLLQGLHEPTAARVRREVAALRLLRVPGVVRLLDEGLDGGAFLVTELVEGSPFPGRGVPRSWDAICATVIALLETLARVHAAGVVHRDLKPENVLVTRDGRPVLLDFGIAWGSTDAGLTARGEVLGTPVYLAPEQVTGEGVSPRADLYAVGVMLYEHLAGHPPFRVDTAVAQLYTRLTQPAPPLREVSPGTPALVAALVDRLLARAPSDRPRSASAALAALRGVDPQASEGADLPRLGGPPLGDLVARVAEGGALDVVGPSGAGKSRLLCDIAAELRARGVDVLHAPPSRRPLGSARSVAPAHAPTADATLDDVAVEVERALRARLAAGAVLIVDDPSRIDERSRAVFERCGDVGRVVSVADRERRGRRSVALTPLHEDDLRPLFAGHERVFHLPSAAARALWVRTQGVPARVAAELDAWVRAGIARREDAGFRVDRGALALLDAGLRVAAPADVGDVVGRASPSPEAMEVLRWVRLAWPDGTAELLARALDRPAWEVEAACEELEAIGAVQRQPDRRWLPSMSADVLTEWPRERVERAHAALARASPPGSLGRVRHLLAGGGAVECAELAREVAEGARHALDEGALDRVQALLGEGLRALRRQDDAASREGERALLARLGEAALTEGTPLALDRFLYELGRAREPDASTVALESLGRAALAARAGGERALALAEAVPPFEDAALEWWRQATRVSAARRAPIEREEAVLDEVTRWARAAGDPRLEASAAGWLGRLRYRQNRFVEAAELQSVAAAGEREPSARVAAMTAAASALLEAFDFEGAARWADRARDGARRIGLPYAEARAEWLLRASAYRAGEALTLDGELVDAVAAVGVPDLEALLCLTEAAVAWRSGDCPAARALAARVQRIWQATGWTWGVMLARALEGAAGASISDEECASLVGRARSCPSHAPGVQALGLLARARPDLARAWEPEARALGERVPRGSWRHRADVVSVDEALAAFSGASR